ncbi:MAG: hypothetical protein J6X53_02840, partial [Abditibacteriota bacterium]|nr:hypothetical protein [Abditibacteriota bacterium]
LSAVMAVSAAAADGTGADVKSAAGGADAAESRNPYRPVRVESYTEGESDTVHILRTYQLSPVDDPAGIPTQDFEDSGWVYHLSELTHKDEIGTDSRQITRTVTKSSDTDNTEKILRKLDATLDVTTEDGYAGTLRLDHTSVTVEAAGYATRNNSVSATRVYPDLNDADLSLIPTPIEDGGRTLTLDDVRWEEGWQTDAQGGYVRYSATATYVGTASARYATGYTVTANYSGEVSRSDVEMVTYYADFVPVREADPVVVPPTPDIVTEVDGNSEEMTETGNDGGTVNETASAESSDTASVSGSSDTVTEETGSAPPSENSGSVSDSNRNPSSRTPSSRDYSGLKRTLASCSLLLLLAGGAYAASKIKKRKESDSQ